jgi:hypothetical protein
MAGAQRLALGVQVGLDKMKAVEPPRALVPFVEAAGGKDFEAPIGVLASLGGGLVLMPVEQQVHRIGQHHSAGSAVGELFERMMHEREAETSERLRVSRCTCRLAPQRGRG